MPPRTPPSPPAAEPLPAPSYPAIESLVERASPEDVGGLFAELEESLAGLKGPRAAQGKKAQAAVAGTRELLEQLVSVRGRLEGEKKGKRR